MIIQNIVGYNVSTITAHRNADLENRETVLKVSNFTRIPDFENVSFELKQGEILGFSGLVGAGRTEIMRSIFGADKADSGKLFLHGEEVRIHNTTDALNHGFEFHMAPLAMQYS